MIFNFSSCSNNESTIRINALKTQVIHNAFGYNGYPYDGAFIKETDDYRRILFEFDGHNSATYYLHHLMICQYIDYIGKYVYYYPTNSVITIKGFDFTESSIEKLKEDNDWNKEVDLSKCIRKKISKYKSYNIDTSRINSRAYDYYNEYYDYQVKDYIKCWLSDIDKNGLELYAIKIVREEYTDMNVFAVIIDTKDDEKYYIQEIFWNDTYIIQIEEFKKRNNWTYDYYS